ncbi:protein kinase [Streptomyces sp. YC537]|uniref:Protein kinase n=1 Tax=Streptomyces boluensis TaxID=1775135 RepID=A0A964US03_9ACTN|nr:protein kinase [Streptomyces boluensis]
MRSGDPVRIGPYVPLGLLGSGGMGRVYLARAEDRLAAVKVIRPEYAENAEFRRRFEREAAVLGRVRSEHAPRLLDTGFDSELLWMATEYLPGPNLSEAVHEFGPLSASGVWRLVGELGRALDELTAAQVVHRDLKPSNVILGSDGAYVIDFGISQAADASSITTTGKAVGTPAYMSPERLRDGRADVVSDVFSLACTLVFAATGRAPFGDGTGVDVMHRVAFEEPYAEVIGELVAADPDLADLLSACLTKDPGLRPTPTRLAEAAAARPWPGHWHGPLHAQVTARRDAYDVLRQVPMDQTVHLRLPGGRTTAPVPPAVTTAHATTPTPAPEHSLGRTVPQGPGGLQDGPPPRGRRRRAYLAVVASLAVCAVALTAFLLTRQGEPASEAGPAPAGSATAPSTPGPAGTSGDPSPSASDDAQGGASSTADRSSAAPSVDVSRTRSAQPTLSASEKPGGGEGSQSPRPTGSSTPAKPPAPPWISQCTYYSGTEITRYGDKGQRVVQVQCMLSKRGYGIGGSGVDGQFGDATRTAVRKFQSARGLEVDGEVGPNTWAALRSRT